MMRNKEKQVATRRRNFLKRVALVQEVYQKHYVDGLPQTVMHRNYIEGRFCISVQTMREYLAINVAQELKRINKSKTT
jgi:hypothetical protein